MAKTNATIGQTNDNASKPATLSKLDVAFLAAIVSALPWKVRTEAVRAILSDLTPADCDTLEQRFSDYYEGVFARLHGVKENVPGPMYNAMWSIVAGIRGESSEMVKTIRGVKARKAKAAAEATAANKVSIGPVDVTVKTHLADVDPTKV